MEKPIWNAPACRTGAPFSSASRTARSLTRSVRRSAIASRTAARSAGGVPGRRDRPVGVLEAALGHAGHQLLGGRAADLEPVIAIDPVPVDEHGVAPDGVHPRLLSHCDPRR